MTILRDLTFKVADLDERPAILELRRRVYGGEFGYVPVDEIDDRAFHLVALDEEREVVAAVRIVGPKQRPFDLEQFVNLSDLVAPDRLAAEIGRLCVRGDWRVVRSNRFLQIGMLKLAIAFARKQRFTDFVMYTFEHLVTFYRGAFFRRLDLAFEHPGYRRQMHLMHLDLVDLQNRLLHSKLPTARLLFSTDLPNFIV